MNDKYLYHNKYIKTINDIVFDGIIVHDGKKILSCNKQFEKILGYSSEELIGKSLISMLTEKSRKTVKENIGRDYSGAYDAVFNSKAGGLIYCSIRGRSLNINGDKLRLVVIKDISGQLEDEKHLVESEKKYKTLFENSGDAVFLLKHTDSNLIGFMIEDSNSKARRLFGYKKKELSALDVPVLFSPESLENLPEIFEELISKGNIRTRSEAVKKDGTKFPAAVTATLFEMEGTTNITIVFRDLSQEERSKDRSRSIAKFPEENPNPVARVSLDLRYLYSNSVWKYTFRNWNCNIEDDIPDFLIDPVKELKSDQGTKKRSFELKVDDSFYLLDLVYVRDSDYINIYAKDITERKNAEKELEFLSFHDSLTGLFNRAFFEAEVKRLDTERQLPLSIIIGDVNGLKLVNDAFGHGEGDLLLCKAAEIFEKSCRKGDVISRYGGDEFAILLPSTTEETAIDITNRIRVNNCEVIDLKIPLSLALGYATKDKKEQKIMDVFKEAEDRMYRRKLTESKGTTSNIITSIEKMLNEVSFETKEHAGRLKSLSIRLGKKMGLKDSKLDELVLLSTLHDIGKVALPEEILLNTGDLSKKEWKKVKKHPEIGYNIAQESVFLATIAESILSHHEWWDGSGYPQGLKGTDIPITSRILSVVDAYDVMVSGRPYKKPMRRKDALQELKKFSGKQFDPYVVKSFLKIIK